MLTAKDALKISKCASGVSEELQLKLSNAIAEIAKQGYTELKIYTIKDMVTKETKNFIDNEVIGGNMEFISNFLIKNGYKISSSKDDKMIHTLTYLIEWGE